jgi:group I intron endonuclease
MKIIGIYKITNPKGKVYIGQSTNIKKRKMCYERKHILKQPRIYNSIQKYGWDTHIFEVIEEYHVEQLNERETYWKQYYLDQFGGDWGMVLFCNLHDNGGGPLSEETRKKISKIHLGKKRPEGTGEKISQAKKGFKYSEESKKLKSKIAKGKPKSQETKLKMSLAHQGKKTPHDVIQKMKESYKNRTEESKLKTIQSVKSIPPEKREEMKLNTIKKVFQFTLDKKLIQEFPSIQLASKLTGVRHDSISQCCRGKNKTAGGFIWRFTKDFVYLE